MYAKSAVSSVQTRYANYASRIGSSHMNEKSLDPFTSMAMREAFEKGHLDGNTTARFKDNFSYFPPSKYFPGNRFIYAFAISPQIPEWTCSIILKFFNKHQKS